MMRHSSRCQGDSFNVRYEGPLMVMICTNAQCAAVDAICEHELPIPPERRRKGVGPYTEPTTEWDEQGLVLSCTYCGKDVT